MNLQTWILEKLEIVKDAPRVVVRDPLQLLPKNDGALHAFGTANHFVVIIASTNLVFRQLYELALEDKDAKKMLLVDRTPQKRRLTQSSDQAPALFYPDLMARVPAEAVIELDLRQFLREQTGDPNWSHEANTPRYARLIARDPSAVVRAYENLRATAPGRFTDHDFQTIVAFAALGIPESAFKQLDASAYWKIGLGGHDALQELETLAPEVTQPIHQMLQRAPAPFKWLADRDPDQVVRAFYLAAILAQHLPNWNLLLANLDPTLQPYSAIEPQILAQAAPQLIALDQRQAERDLTNAEEGLDKHALEFLMEQLKLTTPDGFASVLEKENYSTLLRSLALLLALDNLLSTQPTRGMQERVTNALTAPADGAQTRFVERRASVSWSHLKQAYELAAELQMLRVKMQNFLKQLDVTKTENLSFEFFLKAWNQEELNRLEYFHSALQRAMDSSEFLPRPDEELPSLFANKAAALQKQVIALGEQIQWQLDKVNARFQEIVFARYANWVKQDDEVRLTAQFLRRVLKPHWDPQKEKAAVLIFDGMRYDIWDEMLRPLVAERMEIVQDYAASSILPSETHLTRKALSAGTFPDEFDDGAAESALLQQGLKRVFNLNVPVEVLNPEGSGTGETVRYRAGNLDWYIFELCDKELHKITYKTLQDGRNVPSRPLSFIYDQHIKNIIDTEVSKILHGLAPGTKVFITADHGFGKIAREPLFVQAEWLNEPDDCKYLNARLRETLNDAGVSGKIKNSAWEFSVAKLRLPAEEDTTDKQRRQVIHKEYASVIFPKTGFAFKRPNANFNPDAYSHGGISIQELVIPMVVLRVKSRDQGLLLLDALAGPSQIVEGQEVTFSLPLRLAPTAGLDELRVDVEASYGNETAQTTLARQVLYVTPQPQDIVYAFTPDTQSATDDERRNNEMQRTLSITVRYKDGRRAMARTQILPFTVKLNSEKIIRRVGNLGNILGLTPKSIRG